MEAGTPLVVLDLNVLVAGLLAERSGASSPPARCLDAARHGEVRLCLSPGMLERLRRVLGYGKLAFSQDAIDAISHEIVEWVPPAAWVPDLRASRPGTKRRVLCPDPEDEAVLRVGLVAGAALLVTGDTHLLHQLTAYGARLVRKAGLEIVTPRQLQDRLPRRA